MRTAGKFENENTINNRNAFEAVTNGAGVAAFIRNNNTTSKGSALIVVKDKLYDEIFTTAAHSDQV